ncbi:hypothetical protein D6829_00710 [Candidatus Pacearchaeota archaeon]|nr:MAG: hypothetical protein D6829_00710 [Candidatus Pacearchaeota archaeon]
MGLEEELRAMIDKKYCSFLEETTNAHGLFVDTDSSCEALKADAARGFYKRLVEINALLEAYYHLFGSYGIFAKLKSSISDKIRGLEKMFYIMVKTMDNGGQE